MDTYTVRDIMRNEGREIVTLTRRIAEGKRDNRKLRTYYLTCLCESMRERRVGGMVKKKKTNIFNDRLNRFFFKPLQENTFRLQEYISEIIMA